ncbi:MAG: carboxypeptidase-like regulatory domain-containing protein [Thermoplasmata archaeon]
MLKFKAIIGILLVSLLLFSIPTYGKTSFVDNNANIKELWNSNMTLSNVTITPVGNIYSNGHINFLLVDSYNSYDKLYLTDGENGTVMWAISSLPLIQYDIVNLSSNTEGLLALTSSYLTMYSILNGQVIWQKSISGTLTGFKIGNLTKYNIIYAYTAIGSYSPTGILLYYNTTFQAINIVNGTSLWISGIFRMGPTTNGQNIMFPIPPISGFTGGILINSLVTINKNATSIISLINGLSGETVWTVSNPNIMGQLTSISIGNITQNSYQLAASSYNSSFGDVLLFNISNGQIINSITNMYAEPIFYQEYNLFFYENYFHEIPSEWIPSLPFNSMGLNNLLVEYTNDFNRSAKRYEPTAIEEINIQSSTVVWKVQLPTNNTIAEMYPSNYIYLPSYHQVFVIGQLNNRLYVISNGVMTSNIKYGTTPLYYFDLLVNPKIFTFNNTIELPNLYINTNGYYITFVNSNNGLTTNNISLTFQNSFTTTYIEPISIVTPNNIPAFTFVGIINNTNYYSTFVEGLSINGKTIFTQYQNGSFQYIMGTYFYNSFYPGLNNGQLSGGEISNYIIATTKGLSAWSVYKNTIPPLQITSLTSNIYKGTSPLNISLYVNISGGVSPYTYNWNISNVFIFTQIPYLNYTLYNVGTYNISVQITDSIGEKVSSSIITITVTPPETGNKNYYYNVTGYVTSSSGIPLNGVTITTNNGNQTVTNSRGIFFVGLPNGTWEIKAQKSGYYTAIYNVTINGSGQQIIITMKPFNNTKTSSTTSTTGPSIGVGSIILIIVLSLVLVVGIFYVIKIFKPKR